MVRFPSAAGAAPPAPRCARSRGGESKESRGSFPLGRGPRPLLLLAALGAGEGNRTPDLLITSEPLCRLSYPGANQGAADNNSAIGAPGLNPIGPITAGEQTSEN